MGTQEVEDHKDQVVVDMLYYVIAEAEQGAWGQA